MTLATGLAFGLPFKLPSGERASFVGVHYLYPLIAIALCVEVAVPEGAAHYLYPLIAIALCVIIAFVARKQAFSSIFLTALPAYAVVLVCHFNLKLWTYHLNPVLWDDVLWASDTALRPIVDAAFAIRIELSPLIALDSNFYMLGFIAMFYLSFLYV